MIKRLARFLYWKVLPRPLHISNFLKRLVIQKTRLRVVDGPFKGLQYGGEAHGSAFIPKLLGTYELELYRHIEIIIVNRPKTVLNLGTAEGYYAVGLAKRIPGCQIIGFDTSEHARRLTRELAQLNGVLPQIELHGYCTPEALAKLAPTAPHVVICDIEGGEAAVLRPDLVPWLAQSTLLVELHEFEVAGVEAMLRQRFADTHDVQMIRQMPRKASQFPFHSLGTSWIPDKHRIQILSEWRPERMAWLFAVPRSEV